MKAFLLFIIVMVVVSSVALVSQGQAMEIDENHMIYCPFHKLSETSYFVHRGIAYPFCAECSTDYFMYNFQTMGEIMKDVEKEIEELNAE